MTRLSFGRKLFLALDYAFLVGLAVLCLLPLINVLAISFSSSTAATANLVKFWPVDFNLKSYDYALSKPEFADAYWVSFKRILIGTPVNVVLTMLVAYALSKDDRQFRWRKIYSWAFIFTMLFNGGLIPWYITIKELGLIDTFWALVLPGAVPVFSVILLLNFFRGIPKEIEEAALIDGCGHWRIMWQIFLPLSAPAIATITLFSLVGHWNSWFDGLILMNKTEHYPLQSYLQTLVISFDLKIMNVKEAELLSQINNRTLKASQIFLAALPIMLTYPMLQKYFMKGIVMGSVKG
ncbi:MULTISPECIES: carbohydrate ABC transporter permease [Cohnella]|uniref:Putative aldouronate transport system permease protein n=1 Tax=Cohnella phaseoli TaxID=456490 RepID=A0A3D9KM92_9BACL|nr:carbohydrate ABC transporter permease [Cohnella phaseoli]RED87692.1 putative aldouronate transport system permease protein [Cohnella phaseoli]